MEIVKANHIHAALLAKGMSCSAWAKQHGYKPRTVQKYIQWFAPETGRKPQKALSKEIIAKLSQTINYDLIAQKKL